MRCFTFQQLEKRQRASFSHVFQVTDIEKFSRLSGDFNPLHMKNDYARSLGFESRLIHGLLAASLFSRLVGMYLPGKHALYLSQQLNFRRPIKPGNKLIVIGKIINKMPALKTIEIATQICDDRKKILIDGVAMVKLLK